MPDPLKDIMTTGASQVGMMNTQLATGLATALTTGASQLNMMAASMAAAAPDLSMIAPAGMPMMPGMPGMPGMPAMVAAPAPAPAPAAPMVPTYRMRMIR